jgi:3-oxoacyl-[acyl-carrier protein] reductase
MKWIIVTGATGGLGQAITKALFEQTQYGVISISSSTEYKNKEILENYTDRFRHIQCDLRDTQIVKELYLTHISKIGPIYGLVNNSAIAYDDIASNLNLDKLNEMYSVNVFSAMHLTKYAIRDMLLNKTKGAIVHISSISAHTGYKGLSMYASTKGALEAFSKNIAREWGGRGIRSNCVVPGFMETTISEGLSEEQKDRIYKRTSLKKETNIKSVANGVVFLLSERAESITGTLLHIDSGTI